MDNKTTIYLDPQTADEKSREVARHSQENGVPLLPEQVIRVWNLPVQPEKDEADSRQRHVCAHVRATERELYGGRVVVRRPIPRPESRPRATRHGPPRPRKRIAPSPTASRPA